MDSRQGLARTVRAHVARALGGEGGGGPLHRAAVISLVALIALNVIAVVAQTVDHIGARYGAYFRMFEAVSVAVFTAEYVLRLWVCTSDPRYAGRIRGRVRYALTPLAVVDLLAVLPFYLPVVFPFDLRFLRAFRLFRLVRLLKIGRYSESSTLLWRVLHAKRGELVVVLYAVVTVLAVSSSMMYFVEHDAQPQAFSSIPAAMWWALVTLTTVGYGDVWPVTTAGKVLAGLVAVVGIAVFALPAGILAAGFAEELSGKRTGPTVCPHCGRVIAGAAAEVPESR